MSAPALPRLQRTIPRSGDFGPVRSGGNEILYTATLSASSIALRDDDETLADAIDHGLRLLRYATIAIMSSSLKLTTTGFIKAETPPVLRPLRIS